MAGAKRNGWGPFALLGRIPLVVRVLTVIASLIASGWVARDRVGLLQAERIMYKALVDTTVWKNTARSAATTLRSNAIRLWNQSL